MRAAYPSRLCIWLLACPCLLSLAVLLTTGLLPLILCLDGLLIIIISWDFFLGRIRTEELQVRCSIPQTWSLGRKEQIQIHCVYSNALLRTGRLRLDLPHVVHAKPDLVKLQCIPQQVIDVSIQVSANERGRFICNGVFIELRSRWRLWNMHYQRGARHEISVYPNIKQLADYALLARTNRLALIGVRKLRQIGGDTNFERLRDYQSGDPIQRIDWKASARREELTVRDYQPSQSQNIMLMIDAGRMMVSKTTGSDGQSYSMLDHAINASLLLAYVAIKQGDRVGLLAYANGIQRSIPAAGGERHMHTLIHALHDVQAELVESRHEDALVHVQKTERKRSLIILCTHVLDDVNAMHIEQHCRSLLGRHLPLVVLLRDPSVHQHLEQAPTDSTSFWRASAAAHICTARQGLIDRLQAHGILVLDSTPQDLNAGMVSRYLELKAKHLL